MSEAELREIDRLIAENVMGWKRLTLQQYVDLYESDIDDPAPEGTHPFWFTNEGCTEWDEDWSPSTNPADSKLLRDKLAETWTYVRVDICNVDGKISYIARCWHPGDDEFRHYAETEELAVALCALKSVGIDKETNHA